jgi:DNA relaxase NicK
MITHEIDYLQFTANMNEREFSPSEFKTTSGMPYYPRGYLAHNGTRFNFGSNKGMNCFVVLAGEQCQYLRNCGQSDKNILEWAFANGAKVSRIDLAVTEYIEDELFTVEDVEQWFKQGLITSALAETGICKRVDLVLCERDIQETLYIGDIKKRGKKGIFRSYDKGHELGIGDEIISRIELELKRDKAHKAASRIVESGDIAGNFRTYFDVKHPTFERLMQTPKVEPIRGKGKPKDMRQNENEKRWIWLLSQVAPAMKEAIRIDYENGLGNDNMFKFMIEAGIASDAEKFAKEYAEFKLSQKIITKYRFD